MSGRTGRKKSNSPTPGHDKKEKSEKEKSDKEKPDKDKAEKESEKERRNSVLEGHGYKLGKPIGNGSYATVKVTKINLMFSFIIK